MNTTSDSSVKLYHGTSSNMDFRSRRGRVYDVTLAMSLASVAAAANDCMVYVTDLQTNGDGYVAFLDRHSIKCGTHQAIVSQFQLVNCGDQMQYRYTCCPSQIGQTFSDHYTEWNINPSGPHEKGVNYLDRHHVDCGTKPLGEFNLENQGGGSSQQIRYHYQCGSTDLGTCTTKSNPFTAEGDDREVAFLDRQNVDCNGQLLASFQLNSQNAGGAETMRYTYTCCDAPASQMWPTFTSDSELESSPWAAYFRSLYGELKPNLSPQNPLVLQHWWCFYIDKMAAANVVPPSSAGICPTAGNAPEGQRCERRALRSLCSHRCSSPVTLCIPPTVLVS